MRLTTGNCCCGIPPQHDPADFPALAERADVVVGGGIPTPWPDVPKLKLFQIPWTGFDFTAPEKMPSGVPVANTYEHESSIAEYVLLGMLEWQIGLRHLDAEFRAKGWAGIPTGQAPTHGEVRGKTVGIVGYGHIGHETAVRARAFGMRCIGIRRSAQPCPPELDWLGQPDRLDELLGQSDYVLIACDMNEETIGMINADRLAAMKPDGVIINVARGTDHRRGRVVGGAVRAPDRRRDHRHLVQLRSRELAEQPAVPRAGERDPVGPPFCRHGRDARPALALRRRECNAARSGGRSR